MQNATTIALSRLVAQQRAMDVTANNLANADTPGFKTGRTLFADWLSRQTGADTVRGGQVLAYTQDRATYREQAAGALIHTANPLDLAITGPGFFTVQSKAGPMLTRAGRFELQADGTVADADGNALLDTGGQPLRVAAGDVNKMQAVGNEMLSSGTATAPVAQPKIVGGALEQSNVQPVAETTRMMNGLREFQFVSQFVEAEGQRQQSAIDKLTQHNS